MSKGLNCPRIIEKIARMTEHGMCQADIAKHYGVTRAYIGILIRKAEACGHKVVRRQPRKVYRYQCRGCGKQCETLTKNKGWCSPKCHAMHTTAGKGHSSRHAFDEFECCHCGNTFTRSKHLQYIRSRTYQYKGLHDSGRKFCSHECYLSHRWPKTSA